MIIYIIVYDKCFTLLLIYIVNNKISSNNYKIIYHKITKSYFSTIILLRNENMFSKAFY